MRGEPASELKVEYVHIERGGRFEIKARAHCAADGVAPYNAIALHLIDGPDDLLNSHTARVGFVFYPNTEGEMLKD